MKNLMSNLKEMNYKEFAVNHAEKFILSFIALFVVYAVSTSEWTTEKRTPKELEQKVTQADSQIKTSQWPEEKRKEFLKEDDLPQKVAELIEEGLSVAKYRYSIPPSWPVEKQKEKAKEVVWLPVEDLVATSDRFIMSKRLVEVGIEEGGSDTAPEETGNDTPADDMDTRFKQRTDRGRGGASANLTFSAIPGESEMAAVDNPATANTDFAPPGGIGDDMMGQASAGPERKGRGLRFIAVRGVFDLEAQQDKLQRALGDAYSIQDMQNGKLLDFLDFELERKIKLINENDPWSGDWEKVDIQTSIDVLKESADFDPPVVNTSITDRVFTMPLPSRIAGFWYKVATHPRVENFTLSQEEIEQELELNQRFLDEYKKTHANEKVFKEKQKGFSELQLGMRQIRSDVMSGGQQEASETVFQEMADTRNNQTPGEPLDKQKFIQKLKANANAVGRLLLFRYFDFDLKPGATYRYRVRLVVRNPNYQRPIEEVDLPSVAEGEIRTTPWSKETADAHVEQDVHYFLSKVQPPRGISGTTVTFEVFQWYSKTGTTIHSAGLKTEVGEVIGGEKKAILYDVAKEKYSEDAKVNFDTQSFLVDAIAAPSLRPEDHPDLQLIKTKRGDPSMILPEAIVVDNLGILKVAMHPETTPEVTESYNLSQRRLSSERKSLQWVIDASKARDSAPTGALDGGGFEGIGVEALGGMDATGAGSKKKKKGKRKKNPISLLAQ